jgi:hypothetical protein
VVFPELLPPATPMRNGRSTAVLSADGDEESDEESDEDSDEEDDDEDEDPEKGDFVMAKPKGYKKLSKFEVTSCNKSKQTVSLKNQKNNKLVKLVPWDLIDSFCE